MSKTKEIRLSQWIGTCRCVYNLAKELKDDLYARRGISISRFDLDKQLPELKKEFDWIADVPSQSLQDVLERLDRAYNAFFKQRDVGYPKWAAKHKYNSITFKRPKHLGSGRFKLPKLGEVATFYSRDIPFDAVVKRATVIKETDGFYITVTFNDALAEVEPKQDRIVGLDWGVAKLASLSDGTVIENPLILKKFEAEKKELQRTLARRKLGGVNWRKTKKQLNKIEAKIARVRNDYQHKVTTLLADNYDVVVCEDIKFKNITRSAKGSVEAPGKNVKAKSGLNRSILDTAPGMFFDKLDYKLRFRGGQLIKVNAKNTSRECNACGHTDKKNRKSQAEFECQSCGHTNNADINAAKNILKRGLDQGLSRKPSKLAA